MLLVGSKSTQPTPGQKADTQALLEKQSRSIQTFGERVAQSIQSPFQGASSALGSLLTSGVLPPEPEPRPQQSR